MRGRVALGPRRVALSTERAAHGGYVLGMNVAAALAPLEVLDLEGAPLRLGSLWEEGPAVIVFLRHYG